MPAITMPDLNNAKLDVEHIAAIATSTELTATDRLGQTKRTLKGQMKAVDDELAAKLDNAQSQINVKVNEAARHASDSAASALEAYGYLQAYRVTSYGALAIDPATDPLGNPPTVGDEYFNTTSNLLKRWNGTTWQASDINTANLAAPSGSSLVGYDGGTVQDVLDGAKSMQDYAALRAYTGRASRVYITGLLVTAKPAGISGTFQHDPTDTTTSDNNATVIVLADGRRFKRDFTGAVNVKWFLAKGDGVADDAAAFQAAINYCLSKKTTASETLGGGLAALYVPQGIYSLSSLLNVTGANGFKIFGDGKQSTQIVFTGSASNLFSYTGYICCDISDLSLIAGSIGVAGSLPAVAPQATKNNTCIKFNGDGGGTLFTMNRVQMYYWDKVFTTTNNIVNCDNHIYNECSFFGNNYVWDNSNPQAVVWTFNNCKVYSTQTAVFNNAGGDLVVNGGDYINPGVFYRASLTNMGYDALFNGVRFENYQNIDPTSSPKFIELVSGGSYPNIVFDHCTARGGGILTGKTSGILAGTFNITLRDCSGFSGNWEVNASSSASGFLSGITFERCVDSLVINQTLSGAQSNNPINIEYIQRRVSNTTANRRLYGRVNSLTGSAGIFGGIQSDSFGYEASLNASSFAREYSIFCPSPYQLAIAGFDIVWTNNTTSTVVIDIYTDNTKATKIASVTTASASGQRQVISIKPADLLVRHTISSTSSPLYFEVTAAGNAGKCSANVNVNLLQV